MTFYFYSAHSYSSPKLSNPSIQEKYQYISASPIFLRIPEPGPEKGRNYFWQINSEASGNSLRLGTRKSILTNLDFWNGGKIYPQENFYYLSLGAGPELKIFIYGTQPR